MERYQEIERSIMTTYRKKIWNQFTKGIREFDMIQSGDKIAVCISGGKDSMLLAKCMQELQRHGKIDFELVFLVMNPGYNEINKQKIISNAKLLNIPITMFESNIFEVVEKIDDHPCYICARMRRGHLYRKAKELGCNKIALGHHFDDVVETILIGMLYGSQMQTMMPKLHSTFHEGMELIRPLYYVKEENIITSTTYVSLLNCNTHILISLINETPKYEEFLSKLKEKLETLEVKETDFNRKKKVLISNEILAFESVEAVNDIIIDNIIYDKKIAKKSSHYPIKSIKGTKGILFHLLVRELKFVWHVWLGICKKYHRV